MNAIIKKKGGEIKFSSETELENFVLIHLDKLLNLSPISRQYRVGNEICDILAIDSYKKLSIIELKNTEDRYIVQQLTRYYHGLIENKPHLKGIDYSKPIKLIAIAPSFHAHNFVDKIYTNLNFEFFTFELTVNKSTGDILFELTNVDTKEKYVEQISQIKHSNVIQGQEAVSAEIDYNEMIDYYMRLNYSSKLEIEQLSPEQLRERAIKYKSKCTKVFKVNIQFVDKTEITRKSLTIKLPSKVRTVDYIRWWSSMTTAWKKSLGAKDIHFQMPRANILTIKIFFYNIYE